jgi:hypothetical protein
MIAPRLVLLVGFEHYSSTIDDHSRLRPLRDWDTLDEPVQQLRHLERCQACAVFHAVVFIERIARERTGIVCLVLDKVRVVDGH